MKKAVEISESQKNIEISEDEIVYSAFLILFKYKKKMQKGFLMQTESGKQETLVIFACRILKTSTLIQLPY